MVLPKAEKLLKVSIQPYISSILEALLEPTSRGFFEVREVFFRELVDMSKNVLNEGTKEMVAQVRRGPPREGDSVKEMLPLPPVNSETFSDIRCL